MPCSDFIKRGRSKKYEYGPSGNFLGHKIFLFSRSLSIEMSKIYRGIVDFEYDPEN